jgi:Patched family
MTEDETVVDNATSTGMGVMSSPSPSTSTTSNKDDAVVKTQSVATIFLSLESRSITMELSDSLSSEPNASLEDCMVEEEKQDKVPVAPAPVQVVPLDQILNPNISFANEMEEDDDNDNDNDNNDAVPFSPASSTDSSDDDEEEEEEEENGLTKVTSFDTTDESNTALPLASSSPTSSSTSTEEEEEEEEDSSHNNNDSDSSLAQLDATKRDLATQFENATQIVPSQDGTLIDLIEMEEEPNNNNRNTSDNDKTYMYDLPPIFPAWTRATEGLQRYLRRFLIALALVSARNPYRCIGSVIVISLGLVLVGLNTNFHIEVDEEVIYAPFNSLPRVHQRWHDDESGLGAQSRGTVLMIHNKEDKNDYHNDTDNFLSRDTVKRVFQALDTVRNTTGFQDIICHDGAFWDEHAQQFTCRIMSATRFWYHDQALFDQQVQSDEDLVQQLSATQYPGGAPVDPSYIMGNYQRDDNGTITYAPAFFVYLFLTDKPETEGFELAMLQRLSLLQKEWELDPAIPLVLDYTSVRSPTDEFRRAIENDMYLVPIVAIMMSGFTCLVYLKPRNMVQSRCLLGVGMVTTILMAMFTGFGIMFIFGVPFTSMTQLLPFILFGVG